MRRALLGFGILALLVALNVDGLSAESADVTVSSNVTGKVSIHIHNLSQPAGTLADPRGARSF